MNKGNECILFYVEVWGHTSVYFLLLLAHLLARFLEIMTRLTWSVATGLGRRGIGARLHFMKDGKKNPSYLGNQE